MKLNIKGAVPLKRIFLNLLKLLVLWLSSPKQILRIYREKLTYLALEEINKGKILIPFLYIAYQKRSKKYLIGGLAHYKYFPIKAKLASNLGSGSIFRALWVIYFKKQASTTHMARIQKSLSMPFFNSSLEKSQQNHDELKISNFKLLSILPATWARNLDDRGFPHAYHFLQSAELAGVSILDFPTSAISSNPNNQTSEDKKHEWELIEELIVNHASKIVVISGHKRSFDSLNKDVLLGLKTKHGLTILLLMLDDWSIDYLNVVQNWGEVIDKVLVYEVENIISKKIDPSKVLVWPFPRLVKLSNRPKNFKISFDAIKFVGSPYLNRIPWLFFISLICRKNPGLKLKFDSATKIGKHKKSVGDYFDLYSQGEVTLHFLERTPNVYSFTSSVWDAFACGSLVIAQVGINHDPISDFFRPGIDYLPFTSLSELMMIFENLRLHPNLIEDIAISGQNFMKQNYNANKLFSYLFSQIA
jgi:hypothetical protein